jgi:hypothetical protein
MDPATLSLVVGLVQVAIQQTPGLISDFQKLFASGNPTQADFEALKASIAAETYGSFVPASALPASETGK